MDIDNEEMKESFRRFAETNEPSDLENALNDANDIKENGKEKSIEQADKLIMSASQRVIEKLKKLNIDDTTWKDDLNSTGKLLKSSQILINDNAPNKIDLELLQYRILERCANEINEDKLFRFLRVTSEIEAYRKGKSINIDEQELRDLRKNAPTKFIEMYSELLINHFAVMFENLDKVIEKLNIELIFRMSDVNGKIENHD